MTVTSKTLCASSRACSRNWREQGGTSALTTTKPQRQAAVVAHVRALVWSSRGVSARSLLIAYPFFFGYRCVARR